MTIAILLSVVAGGVISGKGTDATIVYNDHTISGTGVSGCPDTAVLSYFHGASFYRYYPSITCTRADNSWNSIVLESPTKLSINSGDSINVSGYIYSTGCQNSAENLTVYVSIRDSGSKDVTSVHTASYGYGANGYFHNASSNTSRFSFNIPQKLAKGDYYVSVSTYEDWSPASAFWRHWGWLVDYTKIHISDTVASSCVASSTNNGVSSQCSGVNLTGGDAQGGPLTQSCTPSSATVAINQPVTWTIHKSGGIAPYTYDLGDASGHVSSSTITRTYTTLGTKTMNYSLADASSTLPVTPQACSSVNVVANLTCNLAGKTVANGSVTRLYAEETANCGNYTDFTCSNGTLSAGDQTVYKNTRCIDASGPAVISYFVINPDTVNKNEPCSMNLKVDNAQACVITGNNGDNITVDLDSLGSASTTKQSAGLQVTSMYTLTCTNKTKDAAGNFPTVSKTQKCYLNADAFEK